MHRKIESLLAGLQFSDQNWEQTIYNATSPETSERWISRNCGPHFLLMMSVVIPNLKFFIDYVFAVKDFG